MKQLEDLINDYIYDALVKYNFERVKTWRNLGISSSRLRNRIKILRKKGIHIPESTSANATKYSKEHYDAMYESLIRNRFHLKKVAKEMKTDYYKVYHFIDRMSGKYLLPDFSKCEDIYDKREAINKFLESVRSV